MAKNNAIATDKAKGSAGNVTFANWKGIDYFKQKAESVSNPKTDAQQTQRTRMTLIVAFFRVFAATLNTGFREMAVKMSAYNAFAKYNVMTAVTITTPTTGEIDIPNLQIAKGSLGATPMDSAVISAGGVTLTLDWEPTVQMTSQSVTDGLWVLLYNRDLVTWQMENAGANERGDGTLVLPLTTGVALGNTFDVFTFFYSKVTNKVSDSRHNVVVAGA